MEQNAAYKQAISTIKDMEHQLALCENSIKEGEDLAVKGKKEIREHFLKCAHDLASHEGILLQQVSVEAENHSMFHL